MPATLHRSTTRIRVTDLEALMCLGAIPTNPSPSVRTVADVKTMTRRWVREVAPSIDDLIAAHLTGGITSLTDEAPFPAGKDVDLHLIVDHLSSALTPTAGTFFPILEVDLDGIPLEAGIKPMSDYGSPEAVLSNPEIAIHVSAGNVLHDPLGILADVIPVVRREYARRGWVRARLAHEREGHAAALAMLPWVREMSGAVGELSILGYTVTFLPAALQVATLSPLRIGSRMLVNLRQQLAWLGELDLYEEVLGVLGVRSVTIGQAEALLAETMTLFDRAVAVRVTPHPFAHKLHAHQRAYLHDACRRMIDEGHHREAACWATPFYGASTDVLLADGPPSEHPEIVDRRAAMLRLLDREDEARQAELVSRAHRVAEQVFALADRLIEAHPGIED